MLAYAKKIVAVSVMALVTAAISLPMVSLAATSPVVSVLGPINQGLRAPAKVVLDAAGNIYVADQRVGGIVKFDTYGVRQLTIPTAATPNGVAFAQDGTMLVSQGTFVARYNVVTGQEVGRLADGYLQAPSGIAVDNAGFIYVADSDAKQIVVFASEGSYIKVFGAGLLLAPAGITFEKVSGLLAVADASNYKIKFFDTALGVIAKSVGNAVSFSTTVIVNTTIGAMQFEAPVAVAFEYSKSSPPVLSRMYVVDAFQSRIQTIDPVAVSFLSYIGAPGTSNGQLMGPTDAVFDGVNNRLLVVNGYGNITIYGIDGGKNPIYVDVTPPVFTVNQLPAVVTTDTITISGTVEAGATVQIVSGSSLLAGTVQGTTWSAVVSGLALGNNNIIVTATDSVGNVAAGQTIAITYLLPAPAVTISPLSSMTKNVTLTLSGTVDAGSSVDVVNQATSVAGSAVVSGGTWSYDTILTEGVNNLVVTASKPLSLKAVASAAITLDTKAPALAVSALPNGSYTSAQIQNITGTVSDLNGVAVTLNGAPVVVTNNAFSVPVTLANGANQITIAAFDTAGNASVDSRVFYFDASVPVITILAPVDNSYTANATLQISGSVDKTSVVIVAGASVSVQDRNWSASVNLAAGVNTIVIAATDLYGNSSSVKRTITLDTTRPELSIVSPAQDVAVNVPHMLISGTVTGNSTYSVDYSVNSTPISVPVINGTYSFIVDFAAEGIYPVTVSARDAAGNTSTVVRNLIYDITPPAFTLDKSTLLPVRLTGTVEAGATVKIMDGSTVIGSVLVSAGTWSADLTGVTYNPGTVLAVATDGAGNSTSKALSYM